MCILQAVAVLFNGCKDQSDRHLACDGLLQDQKSLGQLLVKSPVQLPDLHYEHVLILQAVACAIT